MRNNKKKYRRELFHLDRSIGLFSLDEIAKNPKDNSAWVNSVDEHGNTPLHIAASNREIAFVRSMLPHFERVNAVNDNGDTVLHLFIDNCMTKSSQLVDFEKPSIRNLLASKATFFNKKHRIVKSLLAKGSDVNLTNKQGISAAQLAAKRGYFDALKILLESAKQRLHVHCGRENLLHLVCKNTKSIYKDTATETKVMGYLIEQGCDVEATDADGYSALHYALQTRSLETTRKLVRLGFNVRRWDEKTLSRLLLRAAATSNPSFMRFLMEQGANVNVVDSSGARPLHLASTRQLQRYEAMEMLLKSGAHVDAVDEFGDLPLDYALRHENVEGLQCLMDFGMDVVRTSSFRRLPIDRVMDQRHLERFTLMHMTQLKAVGLSYNSTYEAYLARNEWQIYKRICMEEVKELKLCMVDDRTSLYDLLHAKTKHCRYAFLPKLLRNLKSSFPIYYGIIRIRIHEIEKRSLIGPATLAWYELTNVRLPYICVENILSNLNSCCLRMMIRDGSDDDDEIIYNSVLLRTKWLDEC